jgi:hypothetical protein
MNRGTIAWQFGTRATRLALGLRITQMCGEGKHTGRAVWGWMKKLFFKDGVPEEIEAEVGEKGQANEVGEKSPDTVPVMPRAYLNLLCTIDQPAQVRRCA